MHGVPISPTTSTRTVLPPPYTPKAPLECTLNRGEEEREREGGVVEGERVRENREESRRGGGEGR